MHAVCSTRTFSPRLLPWHLVNFRGSEMASLTTHSGMPSSTPVLLVHDPALMISIGIISFLKPSLVPHFSRGALVPWFCFSMHLLTALFPPLIQGKIHKTILKWTISGILVIHRAVQPLRLPNFRTPSPQEEPVSLLLCTESLQPLPSVFVGLPVLGVSCKQPYSM